MTPIRTCVGCRTAVDAKQLVRVVADKGVLGCSPMGFGRGAWLHPNQRCLDLATKRAAWGRALRVSGPIDSSMLERELMVLIDQESAV